MDGCKPKVLSCSTLSWSIYCPFRLGRILVGVLPGTLARSLSRFEPYGLLILIGLLFLLPLLGAQLGINLDPISRLIMTSTNAVVGIILRLTGNISGRLSAGRIASERITSCAVTTPATLRYSPRSGALS